MVASFSFSDGASEAKGSNVKWGSDAYYSVLLVWKWARFPYMVLAKHVQILVTGFRTVARILDFRPVSTEMALRRHTRSVDGTIPVQALRYDDEELVAAQDSVGIYDGYACVGFHPIARQITT